jgi:hypothetical protein
MTEGPLLYDEGPEPLHTGTPRSRRGLLSAIFIGTVAVALLAVVFLPLVTGSATDSAKQVTGVFLKALAKGDTETAHELLCDAERARVAPDAVARTYLGPGTGTVTGATESKRDGATIELVDVRWSGGGASRYTLVNQSGPRICATQPLR